MSCDLSTHVLDAVSGRPAVGVHVLLTRTDGTPLADATTDSDGRIARLGPAALDAGTYQLTFATGDWFAARGIDTFFPVASVDFRVAAGAGHLHVPLLLSPFAWSTYRGS